MPEGNLEISLVKAHDLDDVEFFGKSDPYVVAEIGEQKQRSKTVKDGGSNPTFHESLLFEIPDGPHEVHISIYDQERHGHDEAMGTATISLNELFAKRDLPPTKYKIQRPNGKFHGELETGLKFFPKVHHGVLEVHLVEAHGLRDTDLFGKVDPYAMVYCHKEHQKSRVIEGQEGEPVWDETFSFQVNSDVTDVCIKLFDKDFLRPDEALGTVVVPLHKVFTTGHLPPAKYQVNGPKGQPQGEISVGLKFSSM